MCRRQFKCCEHGDFFAFDRVEHIVEKDENTNYRYFPFFSPIFFFFFFRRVPRDGVVSVRDHYGKDFV